MDKINLFDLDFSNYSKQELVSDINLWLKYENVFKTIYTPNVDFIVKIQKDKNFKKVLQNASVLIADGKPLIWASKFLSKPLKEKISGSSLFFDLCKLSAKERYSIYLLGSDDGVAEKASLKLKQKYPKLNIAGYQSPSYSFLNDKEESIRIIEKINLTKPDILFVGVGAPKQEFWIDKYKDMLHCKVILGIGASIDFAAGKKTIPPELIKNIGFAWLWRLVSEPRRLWKRYLIEDMKFFYYVFKRKYF